MKDDERKKYFVSNFTARTNWWKGLSIAKGNAFGS